MSDQAEQLRQMVRQNANTVLPQSKMQLQSRNSKNKKAKVLTVTSGKGGVGKTNFTVNFSLALAAQGKKILIVDADLGLSNVDVVLGCSTKYNLLDLLNEELTVNDILTEGPLGLRFISGGSGLFMLANLTNFEMLRLIEKIESVDEWADVIIFDTGAGLNKNVLNFAMAADELIVITTPEPTAIADAYATIKAYKSNRGVAPINLIVNRVYEKEEGDVTFAKLQKVSQHFLGVSLKNMGYVFDDRFVVKAVKQQQPFCLLYPESSAAKSIRDIVRSMYNKDDINKIENKGIKGFFNKMLNIAKG